ncbi:hypothetical protein ACXYTJ_17105 [Gilvimarinus sp. F26214L]|uniref:hypothetical protein n=1 Tax=Gilvimarinus sp. DZF01 TaxID=3461371 RepID=UPI004045F7A5
MALTSLFSGGIKAQELLPRSIDLSGNIFQFSLPEDFSRDMPAANMVERLDIRDRNNFDVPEYGNLMRRWWDIKEPGWFGKRLGTTMMDLSVQRVAANTQNILHERPYSIGNRLDFMLMLIDRFHQRYDSLNEEVETPEGDAAYHSSFVYMVGERIASTQREY